MLKLLVPLLLLATAGCSCDKRASFRHAGSPEAAAIHQQGDEARARMQLEAILPNRIELHGMVRTGSAILTADPERVLYTKDLMIGERIRVRGRVGTLRSTSLSDIYVFDGTYRYLPRGDALRSSLLPLPGSEIVMEGQIINMKGSAVLILPRWIHVLVPPRMS